MNEQDIVTEAVDAFLRGEPARSRSLLTDFLGGHPESASAWLTLGQILMRTGESDEGLNALRNVPRLLPMDEMGYAELGAAYALLGHRELASECENTALALADKRQRIDISSLKLDRDFVSAIETLSRDVAEGRGGTRELYELALIEQSFNDYPLVIACLRPLASSLPACAPIKKAIADFLWASVRLQRMSRIFAAEIRGEPTEIEFSAAELIEVEDLYSDALRHDPNWAETHTYFANFLNELGRHVEADTHYGMAASCAPADPIARFNAALSLERNGRIDRALSEAGAAIRLKPDFGEAHLCLARLTANADRKGAASHLSQALSLARFATTSANL